MLPYQSQSHVQIHVLDHGRNLVAQHGRLLTSGLIINAISERKQFILLLEVVIILFNACHADGSLLILPVGP